VLKIVRKPCEVPEWSTVTKLTGSKQYTLRKKLRIFAEKRECREIECEDGFVFLVDGKGDVNMHPAGKELCWLASREELLELLKLPSVPEPEERLLGMLESLLSITAQFIEGDVQLEHADREEWQRISAEVADIRDGDQV
jgi:hypothetical protein